MWVFEIAIFVACWRTENRWLLLAIATLGGTLVVLSGVRCLALVRKPDATDFFPDWPVALVTWWAAVTAMLGLFVKESETPAQRFAWKSILRWYAWLSQAVAVRVYAIFRLHWRAASATAVLIEQCGRSLLALSAVLVGGSAMTRLLVGPQHLNSAEALSFAAAAVFPGASVRVESVPILVGTLFAIASWILLALFVLPLLQTFPEWREHRSLQMAHSRQVFRLIAYQMRHTVAGLDANLAVDEIKLDYLKLVARKKTLTKLDAVTAADLLQLGRDLVERTDVHAFDLEKARDILKRVRAAGR